MLYNRLYFIRFPDKDIDLNLNFLISIALFFQIYVTNKYQLINCFEKKTDNIINIWLRPSNFFLYSPKYQYYISFNKHLFVYLSIQSSPAFADLPLVKSSNNPLSKSLFITVMFRSSNHTTTKLI